MPIQLDSVRSIKEIDYNSVRRNKSENPIKSSTFSAYHDSLVKQIQSKNDDIKLGTEGSCDSMEHTAKFKHSLNENYYNNYSESNSKCESITSKSKMNTLQNTFNDLKAVNNHHEVLKDITNRKTNKRNKKYK